MKPNTALRRAASTVVSDSITTEYAKRSVIHPNGKKAWVAHTNADVVAEMDLESWKIVRLLTAGREPDGMAYSALEVAKK